MFKINEASSINNPYLALKTIPIIINKLFIDTGR